MGNSLGPRYNSLSLHTACPDRSAKLQCQVHSELRALTILLFHQSLLNVPNVREKVTHRSDLGGRESVSTGQVYGRANTV